MSRYSLAIAVLFAATYAVQSPRVDGPPNLPGAANKAAKPASISMSAAAPAAFLKTFFAKSQNGTSRIQVLYVTVPHPLETHLASAFDHNLEAVQEGLQDAGYIFDSAWIPWRDHPSREQFDGDEKEKLLRKLEDETPGILLFRARKESKPPDAAAKQTTRPDDCSKKKNLCAGDNTNEDNARLDPYANGLIVFLITEKPTEGLSIGCLGSA